jgi:hypothetical protein
VSRQDQAVEAGGTALQAGQDITVIHQGVSPQQMSEIMVAIATTAATFTKEALDVANRRIDDFQEQVLKRFTETGKADPEAFKDPDFQYLLRDAQDAIARSGDEAVRDTLVDIIAQRSLEKGRTRLAITLNDAATKAVNLTHNEFSALSLVYLVRYTLNHSINNLATLGAYIEKNLMPFAKDVSREESSFWHIEAQSCGSVEMGEINLQSSFQQNYGGVLGTGFTREQLESHLPDGKKSALDRLIIPCINDPSKLQPGAIRFEALKDDAARQNVDLTENELRNVWSLFENTITDIPGRISSVVAESALLFDVWEKTSLKRLKLTTVGVAIGHANATKVVGLDAPLNIWIK